MFDWSRYSDLSHTLAGGYIKSFEYPWQAICGIKEYILRLIPRLGGEYALLSAEIAVHRRAVISKSALICPPCIIGASELRHGAYIRGGVIIGDGCVIGNSSEVKNSVLCDGVKAPHFNYIGDSILGFCAHTGAGAIISNVRGDRGEISVSPDGVRISTGLKKLGAVVGDGAEIGCNCVVNPGALIGRKTSIYPLVSVRGTVAPDTVLRG